MKKEKVKIIPEWELMGGVVISFYPCVPIELEDYQKYFVLPLELIVKLQQSDTPDPSNRIRIFIFSGKLTPLVHDCIRKQLKAVATRMNLPDFDPSLIHFISHDCKSHFVSNELPLWIDNNGRYQIVKSKCIGSNSAEAFLMHLQHNSDKGLPKFNGIQLRSIEIEDELSIITDGEQNLFTTYNGSGEDFQRTIKEIFDLKSLSIFSNPSENVQTRNLIKILPRNRVIICTFPPNEHELQKTSNKLLKHFEKSYEVFKVYCPYYTIEEENIEDNTTATKLALANYTNSLLLNHRVYVPVVGDKDSDQVAMAVYSKALGKNWSVVPVPTLTEAFTDIVKPIPLMPIKTWSTRTNEKQDVNCKNLILIIYGEELEDENKKLGLKEDLKVLDSIFGNQAKVWFECIRAIEYSKDQLMEYISTLRSTKDRIFIYYIGHGGNYSQNPSKYPYFLVKNSEVVGTEDIYVLCKEVLKFNLAIVGSDTCNKNYIIKKYKIPGARDDIIVIHY